MALTWSEREDELRRTTFAGQFLLDGGMVDATTVRPRATGEPECAPDAGAELAEETRGEQLLLLNE